MNRTIAALFSIIAIVIVLAALQNAGAAADPANGERLAKRWCASCHVVAADQRQGNTDASPFSAMAKLPGIDAAKIALYLLAPHPKMPDMHLSRSEAADLAVYIAAQGK